MGLQTLYDHNHGVKESVTYLLALPFILLAGIAEVFVYLYEEFEEEIIPLWQYVESTHVRGRSAGGRRPASSALCFNLQHIQGAKQYKTAFARYRVPPQATDGG